MTDDTQTVPAWFGWRYIGWFAWTHAVAILSAIQVAFGSVLLVGNDDPTNPLIPHRIAHIIVIANAVLSGVLAMIRRDSPPPAKPTPAAPAGAK